MPPGKRNKILIGCLHPEDTAQQSPRDAVGSNFKIMSGFLAKTNEEWIECLGKLIQMSNYAVNLVGERFSVHANKEVYLSVLAQSLQKNARSEQTTLNYIFI